MVACNLDVVSMMGRHRCCAPSVASGSTVGTAMKSTRNQHANSSINVLNARLHIVLELSMFVATSSVKCAKPITTPCESATSNLVKQAKLLNRRGLLFLILR